KKNPPISTRDEVERNEVKSSIHHLISSSPETKSNGTKLVHQLTSSPPETKSNGTKLIHQFITSSVHQFINSPIHQFINSPIHHLITLKDHLMKKYHIYGFEKLEVYKLALSLSIEIRRLVKSFPKEEQFDLTRQLKRATDSINLSSIIKLRFIFQ